MFEWRTYSYVHEHHSSLSIEKKKKRKRKSRTSVKNRVVNYSVLLSISASSHLSTPSCDVRKKELPFNDKWLYIQRAKTLSQNVTYLRVWASFRTEREEKKRWLIYIFSFFLSTYFRQKEVCRQIDYHHLINGLCRLIIIMDIQYVS